MTEHEEQLAVIRDSLVGKTVEEAREMCKQHGFAFRCRRRDGQVMFGTADLRMDRINYVEENGLVIEVTSIG